MIPIIIIGVVCSAIFIGGIVAERRIPEMPSVLPTTQHHEANG